jgi:hypothetical protein
MATDQPQQDLEARFEEELGRDRALWRSIDIGAWLISLTAIVTLLVLILPLGRTSPWLQALSLYGIFTRASTFVAWKAFLFPPFLLRLEDEDPVVAAAALAVLERHRTSIVKPILVDLLLARDPATVAAFPPAAVAKAAREHRIEERRRFARRWFVAWCLLTVVIWTTLVATGGGPSS